MYRNQTIALVIPAYREAERIGLTLKNIPPLIDRVFVIDDCSPDAQAEVILRHSREDARIELIRHTKNQGPGGAIITGYLASSKAGFDLTVVVGGDHQMDLSQVERFLDPLIDGKADYAKGNRFLTLELAETLKRMPKFRLLGNWIITLLTKIASGYFKVMDVVDGYTAITRKAIETIHWAHAWKGYGYPMDFLVRMNAYGLRVIDVPRTAIYTPGMQQSQIKGLRYALRVSPMLLRDFFWRLRFKYIYLDFHPLVFFYYAAIALIPSGFLAGLYMVYDKLFSDGRFVTGPKAILVALALVSGFQFLLFAFLFDMEESK